MSRATANGYPRPQKLAICVTAHFSRARLVYLEKISSHFAELADSLVVHIVTNANDDQEVALLEDATKNKGFDVKLFIPRGLGHPYLLAWSHFAVFRGLYSDQSISHFMYLEDDTLITRKNVLYWVEGREILRPFNAIPSFLRVEQRNDDPRWYSSDAVGSSALSELPSLQIDEDYFFLNLRNPYQGMYFLDRELMHEHLSGPSSSPDFGVWPIREKAAQGITFLNVPKGCTSRNFVGYRADIKQIDERCLVHHLPNTYANQGPPNRSGLGLGIVPLDDLVKFDL